MPGKIFVNYRRDDERAVAARVRDRLAGVFGNANVFMDVDNLMAGQRFDKELEKALAETDVFLSVIGPKWTELLDERKLSGERDYVREEIAGAMKRGITVIPVLIERTPLPRADAFPDDIRELVLHQKHVVTHEQFGRDVAGLVEAIRFARKPAKSQVVPKVPWRWVTATALSVVAVGWVGAYQLGVPVWAPGASPPQPPVLTPAKEQLEKAALGPVRNEQESKRQADLMAAAETARRTADAAAAKKAADDAKVRQAAADAAEAKRKADEVEQQRVAALKAKEDQQREAAEAKARADELNRIRIAEAKADEERRRAEAEASKMRTEADAARKAEEAERQRVAALTAEVSRRQAVEDVRGAAGEQSKAAEKALRQADLANRTETPKLGSPNKTAPVAETPASASRFDGSWTITTTRLGGCKYPGSTFVLRFKGGAITGRHSGTVSPSGAVRWSGIAVTVGVPISYMGRVNGSSGSGTYRNTNGCHGTFTARRS